MRAGPQRAVRLGLGDRHRGQAGTDPLAHEAEVAELGGGEIARLGAGVTERRAVRREREFDDGLRGRQRSVTGFEHAQRDAARIGRRRPVVRLERQQRNLLDLQAGRHGGAGERGGRLVHPLERLAHAQLALAGAHRGDVVGADVVREPQSRAAVEPPRDARDEQGQCAVLLDVGRGTRRGVEVLLDPCQQVGVRADSAHAPPDDEPAAILRRSSALSSVASSTPCSRATSRSVRPLAAASLTISDALS